MKRAVVAAIVMLAFAPASALAQERAGDAALGAVSGAVVLGPIGAVAGAVVGYTVGPSIARSWGLRGSRSASRRRRGDANHAATPSSAPPTREAMQANGQVGAPGNSPAQAARVPRNQTPPVQGFD